MESKVKSTDAHYYYGKLPAIRKNPRFPTLKAIDNLVYEILLEENRWLSVADILKLLPLHPRTVRFAITSLKKAKLIKNSRSFYDVRTHVYHIDD